MSKKRVYRLIVVLAALVFGVFYSIYRETRLGLDLKGGVSVLVKTSPLEGEEITSSDIDKLAEVLDKRVNSLGVSEPVIQVVGGNRISVEIPGATDTEEALEIIGRTALLEFRLMEGATLGDAVITGRDLIKSEVDFINGQPSVKLQFSREGARKFYNITKDNIGSKLAITIDGKVESSPKINQAIPNGIASITGPSLEEAKKLVLLLNSGSLPVKVDIEEVRIISATLGERALNNSITAGMWAVIFIIFFMVLWYFIAGFIASISLMVFGFVSFGLLNFLGATLTLPGIAGFILSMGMAVDANVIIFEIIKEEVAKGNSILNAIKLGFSKSLSSIIDSNVTTLLIAFILFMLGTGSVKGYSITLGIGILASMFSSIFVTRLLMNLVFERITIGSFGFKSPKIKVDVIKNAKLIVIISAIFVGISSFYIFKGLNYGIDFTGGNISVLEFNRELDHEAFNETILSFGKDLKAQVQFSEDNTVILKTVELNQSEKQDLQSHIRRKHGRFNVSREESIGSSVGSSLRGRALMALLLGAIGIVIYISIRFRLAFAIASLIALIHDIIVSVGAIAFLQYEVNSTFIIAILTILGYSINDTVVVFDRIRDNLKREKNLALTINRSINEVFIRSMNTSLTTAISVITLIAFSVEATLPFLVTFLFGIVAGTYSSIFLASVLVYYFSREKSK